jgi:predicted RNA-binding protein with PUA-like domain
MTPALSAGMRLGCLTMSRDQPLSSVPTQFDPESDHFDPRSPREGPRWDLVTLAPVRALRFVPLDELRTLPALRDCPLLARGSRLSVLPLRAREFRAIERAGA